MAYYRWPIYRWASVSFGDVDEWTQQVCLCIDMCTDVCTDMCTDMCKDMCTDVCMDMCIDICIDTCIDMCEDMCKDMCGLPGHDFCFRGLTGRASQVMTLFTEPDMPPVPPPVTGGLVTGRMKAKD